MGDWYANILFSKPQHVVLCISERTLLPIVLPAKQPAELPQRLCASLETMLQVLDVPPGLIARELEQMHQHHVAPTASKSALGSLNDFMYHLSLSLKEHADRSLLEHALHLSEIPCKPLEYAVPSEATVTRFQASKVIAIGSGVS